MASTKNWTPSEQDFNSWTERDEKKAIEETAQQVKVRHIIKNGEFWAMTPGGAIYKLPLFLSIKDFEALSTATDDTESIAQVKRILRTFAGEQQAERLEREPMQVAFNLLSDYGQTLTRTQGVDMGKSQDSAERSSTPEKA